MKTCKFDPIIWIFVAKSQFLVLESWFFSTGHITRIPGATTFLFEPPPKIFSVFEVFTLLGPIPVFGHFWIVSLRYYNYYKHPKFATRQISIWEKGTFFIGQFCPVVARTWRPARSALFLGSENSVFGHKILFFCNETPNFVDGLLVALGKTIHFAPWDRFFDFSFPTYGHFQK